MYHLRIEIPGLPSLQSGAFGHWSARRRHDSRWKELVGYSTLGKRPEQPLERAFIVCTRYSASRKAPDFENLAASFKPLLDGLVNVRVLIDDNQDVIGQPEYHWEKCPRGEGRVVMEVSEVGAWAWAW